MKKALRVVFTIIAIIIAGVLILALYVKKGLPNVGAAPDLKVELTPERVDRGQYLALHVAGCMVCHSVRNDSLYGGPIEPDSLGAGGELFGKDKGLPGNIYASNLTPYALGKWTDGELFRAITSGVSRDGHALFPLMNYPAYGKMDKEDIYSLIAYLRTLRSVSKDIPLRTLDFPVNFIVNTIPAKAALVPKPDSDNNVAYGRYLVAAGSCIVCHSKENKGNVVPGSEFGGGRAFGMGAGKVIYSANITPDKETGIGEWDSKLFVRKFKQYADSGYRPQSTAPGEGTVMPWLACSGMQDKDLAAIFAYLETLKPIHEDVRKLH